MATFVKIEMIYDTDSDGITVEGYTVHTEINKIEGFHKFTNHSKMTNFVRSLDADLVIYPNGNMKVKPHSLELQPR